MHGVGAETVDRIVSPVPYLVAHRAGNHPAAAALHDGLVLEADLHLHGGRVEVRHLKSAWPLPLLWDGRRVVGSWRRRLRLETLLAEAPRGTALMLDLKGPWPMLARLVRDAIEPIVEERPFSVCARWWPLLASFEGLPVRRVHSVGSARQLDLLLRRSAGRTLDAVVVPERLLDARVMAAIRSTADEVLTWPVNEPSRARELIGLGVRGLISDRPDLIRPCLEPAGAVAA